MRRERLLLVEVVPVGAAGWRRAARSLEDRLEPRRWSRLARLERPEAALVLTILVARGGGQRLGFLGAQSRRGESPTLRGAAKPGGEASSTEGQQKAEVEQRKQTGEQEEKQQDEREETPVSRGDAGVLGRAERPEDPGGQAEQVGGGNLRLVGGGSRTAPNGVDRQLVRAASDRETHRRFLVVSIWVGIESVRLVGDSRTHCSHANARGFLGSHRGASRLTLTVLEAIAGQIGRDESMSVADELLALLVGDSIEGDGSGGPGVLRSSAA